MPYVIVWLAEENREDLEENLEELGRQCSIVSFGVIPNDREMEMFLTRCLVVFKVG